MSEEAALAANRVVDAAGSIATGYCGKLFADHGAVVVNAEPPEGFATRREAPFLPGAAAPENSALHAWLSTNKASAVVESAGDVRDLAREAQVVLDDG
ncbi:MAG: CoA transferase, partial [Gammaproteobacteria bacterium]|nr:CoA transferase [Gammaproteobacteria bacterium]